MDFIQTLKNCLPTPIRRRLSAFRRDLPQKMLFLDRVTDFSVLRRVTPHRRNFGMARGTCIDRHYIDRFFRAHQADFSGRVLEVQCSEYTQEFGSGVTQCDVIDIDEKNPERTITADLTHCDVISDQTYECIVLPQTLLYVYDLSAAIRQMWRILKPGGVLLVTLPGIAKVCLPEEICVGAVGEDFWRFTSASARRLFGDVFGPENVEVVAYGNVLSATAFLHGLIVEEFTADELDYRDPEYEVSIGVRARRAAPGVQ